MEKQLHPKAAKIKCPQTVARNPSKVIWLTIANMHQKQDGRT